ncbi:hypothetical protein BT67DRAFT_454683 [Trichocladium antarcticum]|uniref:Uncharacterized protein n=1 Tax=Trichocladium antarcticum TaxID=1450529 RepID=A0AAN6UQT3_9PEZI|nr:hypothetical protein BT67DRAFT_454683 [Trichocladium antarcticum]
MGLLPLCYRRPTEIEKRETVDTQTSSASEKEDGSLKPREEPARGSTGLDQNTGTEGTATPRQNPSHPDRTSTFDISLKRDRQSYKTQADQAFVSAGLKAPWNTRGGLSVEVDEGETSQLCVHLRPWELLITDRDDEDRSTASIVAKDSFDSFGSANSYEDEPWVVRYRRRNVVRKVFDGEVWVEEPALRRIQDR